MKDTFLNVHLQISINELLKDQMNMLNIIFKSLTIDQNVIQVHRAEVIKMISQHIIHVMLIDGQTVNQFKR